MILITGASGFIGRNLALYLHRKSVKVIASGRQARNNFYSENGIPYIKLDLGEDQDFHEIGKGVKEIVHLAAVVPTKDNNHASDDYILTNANNTLRLLKFCVENNIERLLNISSMNVYGFEGVNGVKEDCALKPSGEYADYAIMKIVSELFCEHYRIDYGVNVLTIRLSSVFGDFTKSHLLLSRLVKNALENKEIIIEGSGDCVFDVLYVKDCIKAMELALYSNKTGIYNIGGGVAVSLNEIAQCIAEYVYKSGKSRVKITHVEGRTTRKASVLDIEKARNELGFNPEYSGLKGIEKTLGDYFEKQSI